MAEERIAERCTGFLCLCGEGDYLCLGLCRDPELVRRSHQMLVSVNHLDDGQLIAVAFKDSVDCEVLPPGRTQHPS